MAIRARSTIAERTNARNPDGSAAGREMGPPASRARNCNFRDASGLQRREGVGADRSYIPRDINAPAPSAAAKPGTISAGGERGPLFKRPRQSLRIPSGCILWRRRRRRQCFFSLSVHCPERCHRRCLVSCLTFQLQPGCFTTAGLRGGGGGRRRRRSWADRHNCIAARPDELQPVGRSLALGYACSRCCFIGLLLVLNANCLLRVSSDRQDQLFNLLCRCCSTLSPLSTLTAPLALLRTSAGILF